MKRIIRWKIYLDRSRMYIGYIQFFMIGVVFMQGLSSTRLNYLMTDYALITVPVGLVLFFSVSMVLGWLDTKLGLRAEELRNTAVTNPVFSGMDKKVDDILERVKKLEDSKPEINK